ncbi:aldehyde dehydrogenase family protein [Halioxenophilus sp. WMMB6]|uniref:aldehyde dehydrogenase family protein n=1 Tax=Halioxenophilus sp. WMMB6 TaxID=3073815 RepID=UPI00295F3728|nr:aldehyde dehydrogenase family protein [Halioxenophilus sp. WMMB6]
MEPLPTANLFIEGVSRPAQNGKLFDNISPWTGEVVGQAAEATAADIEHAISAARKAFDETDWSRNHTARHQAVTRFVEQLEQHREQLVTIARVEVGAGVGAANLFQVQGALDGARDLVNAFASVTWQESRGVREFMGSNTERVVTREALGVVGAITPWNVPLYINVGKVIAALLAGCTVVLKPAPDTPLMGAIMGELAALAELPAGVFNVITSSDPAMAGEMLTADPRVDVISFTGSTAVGRRIMAAGSVTLKRVFLELGGKSARIILDDADDFPMAVMSSIAVFHAGQGCALPTRLLVPKSRYQEAIECLSLAYQGFEEMWGDFDNPENIMGPVISKRQQERVMGYIQCGLDEGANLLHGGNRRPDKGTGFFIEPTCFIDVTNDMRIAQEEIFGPVLVVIPFEDDEDAIRIANESIYGLGGYVVSGDLERGKYVANRIRAGAISVNGGMSIIGDLPFGGFKQSGMGREWGPEGICEFTDLKSIAWSVV